MPINFTDRELLWFSLLVTGIIAQMGFAFLSKEKSSLWSPMTVVSLTYTYYCIVGPLMAIVNDETILRTIDHREYCASAWQGAAISYWLIFLSFSFKKFKRIKKVSFDLSNQALIKESRFIFLFSLALLILFSGPDFYKKINFLDNENSSGGTTNFLMQYLMQAIIFFIVPTIMALRPFLEKEKRLYFIFYFLFTFALFLNEAFRYRLVILMVSAFFAYHLVLQKKLNIVLATSIIIPFVLLMGVMEISRNYGRGIDLTRLENAQSDDIVDKSFSESAVFMATGFLIDNYEKEFAYSHFDFAINAIAMPIPRAFWPGKPEGAYLLKVIDEIYGGYGKGQAFLNYGEYYMAFGWYGIVVMSILIGFFLKYVWQWYLFNSRNYYATIITVIFSGMVYVLISRGYFAQYVTLVIYALTPIWIIRYRVKRKYKIPALTN